MAKPFYYLWTYDGHHDRIIVEHNDDRHPADAVTHTDILEDIPKHDDNLCGYAYRIDGGWRITNDEHDEVEDPYIISEVKKAIGVAERD